MKDITTNVDTGNDIDGRCVSNDMSQVNHHFRLGILKRLLRPSIPRVSFHRHGSGRQEESPSKIARKLGQTLGGRKYENSRRHIAVLARHIIIDPKHEVGVRRRGSFTPAAFV